ncbi:DUF3606 domain-containing protein [Aerosticca soli]|uniref:DUF3606 domain-containing protein n=1 Tax=Aerosticca soli TaxID=2010829 RepID=A0A2Z6E5S3_9GAMM|nr:DUF3606 domain-containing protein [Aerosticca soli]BBD80327.1 hypothetical protein ALSL_1674 [Aerosticca soli]
MNTSDRSLHTINDKDPFAIRYWSKQLGVSERELRAAIAVVGTQAREVRRHFGLPQSGRKHRRDDGTRAG